MRRSKLANHVQRIAIFTPLGRRATLEEIAGPFAFLASPAASDVTGASSPFGASSKDSPPRGP